MPRRLQRTTKRRGITLLEVLVSTILLLAALALAMQTLRLMSELRRNAACRQAAVQETWNVLERMTALSWDDITPEEAAKSVLPEAARDLLPGAELTVAVDSPDAGGDAKRIRVTLRWRARSGAFDAPVQLTTWVYRKGKP